MAKDVKDVGVETAADVAKRAAAQQKNQGQRKDHDKGGAQNKDAHRDERRHEEPERAREGHTDSKSEAVASPEVKSFETMQKYERQAELATLRKNTPELEQIDKDLEKMRKGYYGVTPQYVDAIDTKIAALEEEIAALRKERAAAMELRRSISVY